MIILEWGDKHKQMLLNLNHDCSDLGRPQEDLALFLEMSNLGGEVYTDDGG